MVVVVAAVLVDRAHRAAISKAAVVVETHHSEAVATLGLNEVDEEELRHSRGHERRL